MPFANARAAEKKLRENLQQSKQRLANMILQKKELESQIIELKVDLNEWDAYLDGVDDDDGKQPPKKENKREVVQDEDKSDPVS